jgi:hypothetical protein
LTITGRSRRGGLWRQRNFALFWTGESISEVGNSVTVIVVPLVAIDTSLSARDAGRARPGSPGVGGCCFGYNP